MEDDEFYIGYEPEAPRAVEQHLRRVAVAFMVATVAIAGIVAVSHTRASDGIFEYGVLREFAGRVELTPYPLLTARTPHGEQRWWLVAPGKQGAGVLLNHADGASVRLRGSLIERVGEAMIQVEPDSIEVLTRGTPTSEAWQRGDEVAGAGEIVDSKCHLGVMKPGEGATHRDCAVRCLLGGIPPMFVSRGASLTVSGRILASEKGTAMAPSHLATVVGRPIHLRGTLLSRDALEVLAVDMDHIAPVTAIASRP